MHFASILLFVLFQNAQLTIGWKPKDTRIIDGRVVKQSDYPFIASIIFRGKHICGGSIISKRFILTAAHCTYEKEGVTRDLSQTEISVGAQRWKDGDKYKAVAAYPHPRYDKETSVYDLGLFKTEEIAFGRRVSAVTLSRTKVDQMDLQCEVIGWGFTDNKGGILVKEASDTLRAVAIFTITKEECNKFYKSIFDGQICLTGAEGMKGSCNGDSGGPLVAKIGAEMVQIGLVSYGGDCNNTIPEVHTRVSYFYNWIHGKMADYDDY